MANYYFDEEHERIVSKTEAERRRYHGFYGRYLGEYKSKKAAEMAYIEKICPEALCITEDALLDHYIGVSNGGDYYISEFSGRRCWWHYAGYDTRDEAACIVITALSVPDFFKIGSVPLSETADADKVRKIEADRDTVISKF